MSDQDNMDQLMQAFGDHEITNEEGRPAETETAAEASPVEQTTVDETTTVETPHESAPEAPEAHDDDSETPVEDETGKRYVPENRFKEVYGKAKQLERELQAYRSQASANNTAVKQKKGEPLNDQKTAQLENELLFATLPQFNPDHPDHDDDLDALAVRVYNSTPGITKIQAAREAMQIAGKLAKKVTQVKQEARQVKTLQSDHGITSRVVSRDSTKLNPNELSLDQMEEYLKQQGEWDNKNFTKN